MSDILRAIDLSKRFRKAVVLDRMNMAVPEGSVFALVGPNGAGKTTTIKVLMNIHEPAPGIRRFSAATPAGSLLGISLKSATFPKTRRCPSG